MTKSVNSSQEDLETRLESIIARMQSIQRAIKASGQPPSMGELSELKKLGSEYARIIEQLANKPGSRGLA
ncbi:MAG: hypothetical protein JSU75_11695 [Gammaproteobacteria bacterium]|nr:MAG: hypothetical protein JSU75_11695 [Gammaproteobacteria bacterium]